MITAPEGVTAPATSPGGATVDYVVSAVDDVNGPVTVECSPPSGSGFAIGTTDVECKSTDDAGNTASVGFGVHVAGAVEQIDDMLAIVAGFEQRAADVLGHVLIDARRSITKVSSSANGLGARERPPLLPRAHARAREARQD